ncbi:MAG TPA: ABC transporter ATP-binding protein [Chloroflexota bacterium]
MQTDVAHSQGAVSAPAIRLRGVSHRFGATLALDGLDLDIAPGEFVAIVGESGCGKTTALRLMAGLLEPTAGEVELGGRAVRGPSPDVAMMFQRPVLLEWRSVLDNVLLPIEIAGLPPATHAPRARELLRALGLAGFERKRPRQLSGGMQQRVALARALITRPRVLLLDEPFSALDALTREQLQIELLQSWSDGGAGATAVLVTHDIAEAVFLADRVALMTPRPGRIGRTVAVPLPRPRAPEHRYDPAFVALCREIRRSMADLGERR